MILPMNLRRVFDWINRLDVLFGGRCKFSSKLIGIALDEAHRQIDSIRSAAPVSTSSSGVTNSGL
jgi:hypothetical protein